MKFQPGNKLARGGKRPNAGRPPKEKELIERTAAQIARDYIEASVKPVMQTYFQLAHGRLVNKWHEGEIVGQEFECDAPTTRHFIDKLLPDEQKPESDRPIAIQVIVEPTQSPVGLNGHSGSNGFAAQGSGNGGPILIGGD